MSTKFDLERFKAGEVAVDKDGDEHLYLATTKDGFFLTEWFSFNKWNWGNWSSDEVKNWTMKPKEEWVLYNVKEKRVLGREVFESKQAVLAFIRGTSDEKDWEAVKIIRE